MKQTAYENQFAVLSSEEALDIILNCTRRLEPFLKSLTEIDDYVLAQNIIAGHDVPPFDNSAMDGYAVLASDIANADENRPVSLRLIEEQQAGKATAINVTRGTAIKIMTGAPIPPGADTIVPIEQTRSSTEYVEIMAALKSGKNVRPAGEDMAKGSTAVVSGSKITPVVIGLLASLGYAQAKVYRKPKTAIIGTGDELTAIDQPLTPGKIRDSNSYALTAQARAAGAEVSRLGIAKDSKKAVRELIEQALKVADVVVTSGGVSVGDYDFVKDVLAELGAELRFWRVKQKPGKPLAFWTLTDKLIFGLPGYPTASVLCFENYVRPALLKMMGRKHLFRPVIKGALNHDLIKKPGRCYYFGVRITRNPAEKSFGRSNLENAAQSSGCRTDKACCEITAAGRQGSGILKSVANIDGLAVAPADATKIKAGEILDVRLINLPEDH